VSGKRGSITGTVVPHTQIDEVQLDLVDDRLRADCARCFALCCVAPAFSPSADFAIDKPAGQPCPNLLADFRCGIHEQLRPRGFAGCTAYDCFGAGQQVAQVTFGGTDWRRAPRTAPLMFQTFATMRDLHELMWYLSAALELPEARPVHADLRRALDVVRELTFRSAHELVALDVGPHFGAADVLLVRASELARSPVGADLRRADLIGADLRRRDLRGANLRGALLVGADLRGVDLGRADLTGADCRAADLRGADLTEALFLIQSQVDAARGDASTRLPATLSHPAHWRTGPAARRSRGRNGTR
jgi:uncharacterized protein YjbI with pentapeptide repeats